MRACHRVCASITAAPTSNANNAINQRLQQLSTAPTQDQRQVNVTAISTGNKSEVCFCPVVAANVKLNNGRSADVYCLLDSGSNKTVVTQSFKKRFGLVTHQENVTINALGSTSTSQRDVGFITLQSLVDPNFTVQDIEVLVVDSLPIDPSHIPKQADVDKHEHLNGVRLIELPTKEVDILVGTDLAHLFAPEIVRKTTNKGPISFFTPLGWVYMGPASSSSDHASWMSLVT